ncbi:MAG: class I SAM-dependent methyltransferase [Deltaproteobacteria bacterium]|nr:class I SAM-dependent methyltransferase [Deltaproteobacteria bacterium]
MPHEADPPSPFVREHEAALRAAGRHGLVLDLACGRGRHARLLAAWGLRVAALDRSREALGALATAARAGGLPVRPVRADAEDPRGLPFPPAAFAAVVVTRFLFRPLAPALAALLRPGGLLLYETFTIRQRDLGQGPRNPAFLLADDELPGLFPELAVERFETGLRGNGHPEWVASLAARRPS